jgi:3-dehydroquinate dehydratase-1
MTTARAIFRTPRGDVVVGSTAPAVVGTLSSSPELPTSDPADLCDIAEVRFDQMPQQTDWLARCQAIEARGVPVILTVRHKSEGGNWDGPENERQEIVERALENLAAVDLEFRSSIISTIARRAKELGKICIASYHDFERTPALADLRDVVSRAQEIASIVKISTMVREEPDIQVLQELLAGNWSVPLCVIGMGALGTQTRVSFPTLGSCLTYGYMDKSAAPGQLPASELVRKLRSLDANYNEAFAKRRLIKTA